ncbi:MAG TPA: MraY family glycosyltransferase [Treponemataceae bacterium]|nr:MraY family glycosyltransferase [Treponemataceae bacterium]
MKTSMYIVLSFAISAVIVPVVIKICNKFNIFDTAGGRKIHKGNIPRMGGIGFVLSFLIVSIVYVFTKEVTNMQRLLPLLSGGLIIFCFGILDDIITLKARYKLVAQILAAFIVVFFGFTFTSFGPIQLGLLGPAISFIWILGVVNSFNLIDGLDGLCGGLSFFIMLTYGILFFTNSHLISGLCLIFAGALAGFLVYNKPKAKIFMGDGGSQFLGFMVAVLPLYSTNTTFEYNKMPIVFLLASLPIYDTIAAIWRRIRDKQKIMHGDKAHTHHKLLKMGYSTWGVLTILYSIQLFLCITCIISATIDSRYRESIILICGLIGITLFFAIIHYTYTNMCRMQKKSDE